MIYGKEVVPWLDKDCLRNMATTINKFNKYTLHLRLPLNARKLQNSSISQIILSLYKTNITEIMKLHSIQEDNMHSLNMEQIASIKQLVNTASFTSDGIWGVVCNVIYFAQFTTDIVPKCPALIILYCLKYPAL